MCTIQITEEEADVRSAWAKSTKTRFKVAEVGVGCLRTRDNMLGVCA